MFPVSPDFLLSLIVQLIIVVWVFATLTQRVKGLEAHVLKLQMADEEAKSKHETIAKIDAKLDFIINHFIPKA